MNHFFIILRNKITLHKTTKASFFSLIVRNKLDIFIYKDVFIRYINQWRRIVLINVWDW
jgi:hypothetical protein